MIHLRMDGLTCYAQSVKNMIRINEMPRPDINRLELLEGRLGMDQVDVVRLAITTLDVIDRAQRQGSRVWVESKDGKRQELLSREKSKDF